MRNRLKRLRLMVGLNQEEFADQFNLKRLQYANIENGKSRGTASFWLLLQKKYCLSNEETLEMMVLEDEGK